MIAFDMWRETFIFASIYSLIIIVPCIMVSIMGSKMIEELGRYPSKTPAIQFRLFFKLIVMEIVSFGCLIMFYQAFSN